MYLGEQLSDLCCDGCAAGGPCESTGLGFTLPGGMDASSDVGSDGSFASDFQGVLQFLAPDGLSGGLDILNAVSAGVSLVPGVGPIASSIVSTFGPALQSIFHIGAGRTEANVITGPPNHVQDAVFNRIVDISKVGLSPQATIQQLQALVSELEQIRAAWLTFLGNTSHFRDGRASQQAANTIMPYLDGTCGYHWPPPLNPGQSAGCGGSWPDDFGYGAGILGALLRRIVDRGGQIPPPMLTQGSGPFPILQRPIPGLPMLPQAGTLPPVSPLSPIQHAGIFPVGSSGISLPVAIGGAAALALLLMRFRS